MNQNINFGYIFQPKVWIRIQSCYIYLFSIYLFPSYNLILQHKGMNQNTNFSCIFQPKVWIITQGCYIYLFSSCLNHVKWRAVKLKWFTLLCCAEGTRIAFQVYLLLEHVGGPEKDQIFVTGQEISKSSLHIFFLLTVHLLAWWWLI